ncbi:MAG: c-type cytochrome, partial [Rhodocyclaceae bacterium]|nr:c-type cytochrome [Rhodocyclaceae bacterium]
MKKITSLLALFLSCIPALAQSAPPNEEQRQALSMKGDPVRGEAAFVICQGCHRVGALGRADGSYPRLAGQHLSVLIKQMTDVRSGQRSNPKMLPFADHQVLTVQEIADIATFLQKLPVPPTQGQGPGNDLERGRALYGKDCASCHGSQGQGEGTKF